MFHPTSFHSRPRGGGSVIMSQCNVIESNQSECNHSKSNQIESNQSQSLACDDSLRAAIYARVSSDQQAQAGTIQSQVEAVVRRAADDGLAITPDARFIDEGHSGATLLRPALERLRDAAAAGDIDRLYVLCPDRLARSYAYQMLLVDELQRCGVELVFINRPLGDTPEDQMLLQMQGMIAEYERAKILERSRRGKLHGARGGRVSVMGRAPFGYRYLPASENGGQAQYTPYLPEASLVQQIFQWIGLERISLRQACDRLQQQQVPSPSGKQRWCASSICTMLANPAYKGKAAYGKTRGGPMRPRLRRGRNCPPLPRNGHSIYRMPAEQWISIPVPAIVDEALFDAVAGQLAENRRRHRRWHGRVQHLLSGLLVCKCCGYAYCGTYAHSMAGPRYRSYRCTGSRAGEPRLCRNKSLRQEALDEGVWQNVCALLSDPARVEAELRRRTEGDGVDDQREMERKLEAQAQKVRQGIGRLIDAYAEGLVDKSEFGTRITPAKARLSQLQEQLQQQVQQRQRGREMRLVIDNFETFSRQVSSSLEQADFQARQKIIQTLVKCVEIAPEGATIVYRVPPGPFERGPERGNLQHCPTRNIAPKCTTNSSGFGKVLIR